MCTRQVFVVFPVLYEKRIQDEQRTCLCWTSCRCLTCTLYTEGTSSSHTYTHLHTHPRSSRLPAFIQLINQLSQYFRPGRLAFAWISTVPPEWRWCFLSGFIIMSTCSLFLGIATSQESITAVATSK
jgi:hypothetical protein